MHFTNAVNKQKRLSISIDKYDFPKTVNEGELYFVKWIVVININGFSDCDC